MKGILIYLIIGIIYVILRAVLKKKTATPPLPTSNRVRQPADGDSDEDTSEPSPTQESPTGMSGQAGSNPLRDLFGEFMEVVEEDPSEKVMPEEEPVEKLSAGEAEPYEEGTIAEDIDKIEEAEAVEQYSPTEADDELETKKQATARGLEISATTDENIEEEEKEEFEFNPRNAVISKIILDKPY